MRRTYRTKEETVELFRLYQHEYEFLSARTGDLLLEAEAKAKAEAYALAAFELEHNTR